MRQESVGQAWTCFVVGDLAEALAAQGISRNPETRANDFNVAWNVCVDVVACVGVSVGHGKHRADMGQIKN